jgi:benzoate membrane transport protein
MGEEKHRFAAVMTLVVTASGMTLAGIGSAFWGLLLGLGTHLVLGLRH